MAWNNKASAQSPFNISISGPSACVAPLVGTPYTGTFGNAGGCTMLLWTIEPANAGTFLGPDGIDSGLSCVFVSESDGLFPCGFPWEMPAFEGDQFGCGNTQVMPYSFTSHSVTVRWVRSGKLKLKLKERGTLSYELKTEMNVDVLPKVPSSINLTGSSSNHVNLTAAFPPGFNCPNLRYRWRVSYCGGPFGPPVDTNTPNFTVNNNFCNCTVIVRVSTVVGTGATEVESATIQRTFSRIEAPELLGPDYLCKGSTTDFYLSNVATSANWFVDGPAYVQYSDPAGAGIYLPDGIYSYGVNLGVTGTYVCGSFSDGKYLEIPELPCFFLPPPTDVQDRDVIPIPHTQIKVSPTLLKKGEPLLVELSDSFYDLTIIGLDGKIYQTIKNANGSTQIQTAELEPGHYSIRIQNNQNLETKRFIIID